MTYWAALFFLIIINMILAVMFVPFLIVGKHSTIYIMIIILASSLGFIFNFVLEDIEVTDPKHHIIAGLFIPTISIINIYIVVNLSNYFIELTNFRSDLYSPLLISTLYVASFTFPYLISVFQNRQIRKSYKKQ